MLSPQRHTERDGNYPGNHIYLLHSSLVAFSEQLAQLNHVSTKIGLQWATGYPVSCEVSFKRPGR